MPPGQLLLPLRGWEAPVGRRPAGAGGDLAAHAARRIGAFLLCSAYSGKQGRLLLCMPPPVGRVNRSNCRVLPEMRNCDEWCFRGLYARTSMQAPHTPLRQYYGEEQDRAGWVRGLFDRTAGDYDRIERAMALGSGSWYRRRTLARAGLRPGMRVLDIGTGTGLTAREAARLAGAAAVIGVDPSAGMMEHAKVPAGVRLLRGTAEEIPSPASSADFVSMGYALRHVGDLSSALREFVRVLVPGGGCACWRSRHPTAGCRVRLCGFTCAASCLLWRAAWPLIATCRS